MIRESITFASLMCVGITSAQGQIIAQCGASTGFAYYFERGLVPAGEGGWTKDAISGGKILLLKHADAFDIVFEDVSGSRSARAEGANIVPLVFDAEGALILAAYPAVLETYSFSFETREVVWTQAKLSGAVDKTAAYHAVCE